MKLRSSMRLSIYRTKVVFSLVVTVVCVSIAASWLLLGQGVLAAHAHHGSQAEHIMLRVVNALPDDHPSIDVYINSNIAQNRSPDFSKVPYHTANGAASDVVYQQLDVSNSSFDVQAIDSTKHDPTNTADQLLDATERVAMSSNDSKAIITDTNNTANIHYTLGIVPPTTGQGTSKAKVTFIHDDNTVTDGSRKVRLYDFIADTGKVTCICDAVTVDKTKCTFSADDKILECIDPSDASVTVAGGSGEVQLMINELLTNIPKNTIRSIFLTGSASSNYITNITTMHDDAATVLSPRVTPTPTLKKTPTPTPTTAVTKVGLGHDGSDPYASNNDSLSPTVWLTSMLVLGILIASVFACLAWVRRRA